MGHDSSRIGCGCDDPVQGELAGRPVLVLKVDDEDGAIGHWLSLSLYWVLAANIVTCDDSRHCRNRQTHGQYRQMSVNRIVVALYTDAQLAEAKGLGNDFVGDKHLP